MMPRVFGSGVVFAGGMGRGWGKEIALPSPADDYIASPNASLHACRPADARACEGGVSGTS